MSARQSWELGVALASIPLILTRPLPSPRSYATVDPPKNELQHLWDLWALQNEPFASTAPFMMTVGVRLDVASRFPRPPTQAD